MTDMDKKQTGGPHAMLRGLLVVVALALVAGIGLYAYTHMGGGKLGEGPQQVGMLDQEAIYALPEFVQARKELEDLSKSLETKLTDTIKSKKLSPEEAESLRIQLRTQLEQEQAKKFKPLQDRVRDAIASLAQDKKLRVVLDKRIVVAGVTDVTEDVKKRFAENKKVEAPKEAVETQSHVGYINEDVLAELRIFKEQNAKLLGVYQELAVKYGKLAEKASPVDKEKLRAEMQTVFMEEQAKLFKPLNERVDKVITDVAREKGLSLVLNSSHIMWGGRNLTDDVVRKLVDTQGASKS